MVQQDNGRSLMGLACILIAIGAITFTPAAAHSAADPAPGRSSPSTRQKPVDTPDIDATSPDDRARATEQQMTDDERFSLIVSLIGAVPSIGVPRDTRIPEGVNMSAGYTPGIPRLGVPAL